MFITHHRSLDTTRANPTLMYGYGAFAWSASPWFRPDVTAWMQSGGIFAMPNLRGGGEYGEKWHLAGIGRNKQTAIDDYVAAAEWLVERGLTRSDLLAGNAGSASGMVVAAAMIQKPSLFAAVTIDYPALDMVRFDRFTGGRNWRSDFGSTEDREDFMALLAYSPYHTLERGTCYPPTLVLPGERDETTVPMHSYKFVAALQHAMGCENPALLRVSWRAGHSAGTTLEESIDNWADQIAFLARFLKVEIENGELGTVTKGGTRKLESDSAAAGPPALK
jgi:prolyl oligopeptidase